MSGSEAASYLALGRNAEYREQIELARGLFENESNYNRACFEAVSGNIEAALNFLEAWLEDGNVDLDWARRDPDFESIRNDPRFQALVGS